MSTFQRSGLWEGQAPDPFEAQSSWPKLQLASGSSSALRNTLANVTAEPRQCCQGQCEISSRGAEPPALQRQFGQIEVFVALVTLLKHSHRVPALL